MESMTQAQTISVPEAEAARRLRTYRVLFLISILGNLVLCLWCIFAPVSFARALHQPDPFPEAWRRGWGATLLGLHLVYVPGLRNPTFCCWLNWSSIANKFFMTIIFLSSGRFSIIHALGFQLWSDPLIAYYRLMLADVARRPSTRRARLSFRKSYPRVAMMQSG
jgi:hypothetical protein